MGRANERSNVGSERAAEKKQAPLVGVNKKAERGGVSRHVKHRMYLSSLNGGEGGGEMA